MRGTLAASGDADADHLVNTNGTALLIAMLLDQQVTIAWAFRGPRRLEERLGRLDPLEIAEMSPEAFDEVCRQKPAIHRFPTAMAGRIQALCAEIVERYGGRAERIWDEAQTGSDLFQRLSELTGFGAEKAMITVAVLGKRFGVRPPGWEEAAGPFSDDEPRSVADMTDSASVASVKEWKAEQRSRGRTKQD